VFSRPSFQDAVSGVVGDHRGTPDIAMSAAVDGGVLVYSSYNPDDNSYMSYSGQQRPCVSPYLDTTAAAEQAAQQPTEVSYVEAGAAPLVASADLSDDHVQSCFSRYRSYRPEDNSYQPYSGGPRRQCE